MRMWPLLKISVLVQAVCWYRPVSGAGLPTALGVQQISRGDSGFSIITSFFGDPCEPVGCFKESVPMRVCTLHASAQLTSLPAFSSTGRTGKCYCLLRGQVFGFHSWHDEASQSGKLVNCEQISGSKLSS